MSGHAPGNRVNSKFHIDTTLVQCIAELTHFVLRLRNCHTVSRNHYHSIRCGKNRRGLFGSRAPNRTSLLLGSRGGLHLSECTEQHI